MPSPASAETGMDEHEFCERLLHEQQVAVIPGSAFGKGGEGHIRCAYAAGKSDIEVALERMYKFMRDAGANSHELSRILALGQRHGSWKFVTVRVQKGLLALASPVTLTLKMAD
jgi:hypothetical protein